MEVLFFNLSLNLAVPLRGPERSSGARTAGCRPSFRQSPFCCDFSNSARVLAGFTVNESPYYFAATLTGTKTRDAGQTINNIVRRVKSTKKLNLRSEMDVVQRCRWIPYWTTSAEWELNRSSESPLIAANGEKSGASGLARLPVSKKIAPKTLFCYVIAKLSHAQLQFLAGFH